ncbi:MAG TPA: copper resistance CopC family protein [Casimicrobiaceae bacterium]|jgi:hypothetical protein
MSSSTHKIPSVISRALLAVVLAGSALVVAGPQRVSAMRAIMHVTLVKSDPKTNDTLAVSPKAIRLWFSEAVQTGATAVRLTGPDGKVVTTGKVTMAAEPKSPAEAAISEALKPGRYSVDWRTMASDGHPAKGVLTFVIR